MSLYGLPPAASSQFKLRLPTIFLALVLDVGLDRTLIEADSRSEIANRPEAHFAVVDLFNEWKLLGHHPPGIRFEDTHCLGDGHLRRYAYQKMDVVFVSVNLMHFNLGMAPGYGGHNDLHIGCHTGLREYLSSIFRSKH